MLGAALVTRIDAIPSWVRIVVGLTPLLPIAWAVSLKLALIRTLDELQHRILLEALAVAFVGAVVLLFMVDVFRAGGLLPDGLASKDLWPWLVLLLAVCYEATARRYR